MSRRMIRYHFSMSCVGVNAPDVVLADVSPEPVGEEEPPIVQGNQDVGDQRGQVW